MSCMNIRHPSCYINYLNNFLTSFLFGIMGYRLYSGLWVGIFFKVMDLPLKISGIIRNWFCAEAILFYYAP